MEINLEKNKFIETKAALGIKIQDKNFGEKILWIPKSKIQNPRWFLDKKIIIPDWYYDQKIDQLFIK